MNSTPADPSEAAAKAEGIKVLLESIKSLLTIAGLLLAGQLALLGGTPDSWSHTSMKTAVISAFIASSAAILNLNLFVTRCYIGKLIIFDLTARITYTIIVGLIGVSFVATLFFLATRKSDDRPTNVGNEGVLVRGNVVQIGSKISSRVTIKRDPNGNIEEINVNP